MANELSYTGKLFRRIAICCGAYYGNFHGVHSTHIMLKWADDYQDKHKKVYRRNKHGYWELYYDVSVNRRDAFENGLHWLEDNGYIKVNWNMAVRVSRLLTGCTDGITLTEKGKQVAPKYLKMYDPDEKGCSHYENLYE